MRTSTASSGMITTVLTLPAATDTEARADAPGDPEARSDPHARERALGLLRAWSQRWRGDVRDRWIVGPDELMVVAAPAAVAALPSALAPRTHARTTRWALLARARRATRHLDADAEVAVFPCPDPADAARLRVLAVRRAGEDLVVLNKAFGGLDHFRVGKLDHPALLYRLEQLAASAAYWPATSEAHAEAVAVAAVLRDRSKEVGHG